MSTAPDLSRELRRAVRLITAPLRVLPDFVIAGAPKCGTSTLYDWLATHPKVRRGSRKEPTNFIHYPGSRLRSAMHYPFACQRALAGGFLVGDGSVEYFAHPDGPRNVRDIVPEARLIFLLREPIRRAWSDYQMFRKHGDETGDFSVIVRRAMRWLRDDEATSLVESASRPAFNPVRYVQCGLYAQMLERWFSEYPRDQCLVLFSEEFFADPDAGMRLVLAHLGLPLAELPTPAVARSGGYDELMSPETAEALAHFYRPENDRLAALLGRELPWGK